MSVTLCNATPTILLVGLVLNISHIRIIYFTFFPYYSFALTIFIINYFMKCAPVLHAYMSGEGVEFVYNLCIRMTGHNLYDKMEVGRK